jgi:hypothetical protein
MTMLELLNSIKNKKAPKMIRCYDYNWEFIEGASDYRSEYGEYLFADYIRNAITDFLEDEVEVLEKPKEFENIEEIIVADEFKYYDTYLIQEKDAINQLIRNQKKIIKKLEELNK